MYIQSINVGRPQLRLRREEELMTGGDKEPVTGAYLRSLGFDGDGQADLVNHGGPDKAVCAYSLDHYPHWERLLERPLTPGAFSENLTVLGLDERTLCIGDILAAGDALLQVCQPRMPCAKLAAKLGEPQMVKWIAEANYTGCYLRVLAEGQVTRGDELRLVEANPARISIAVVNDIIYDRSADRTVIATLAELPAFGDAGRTIFRRRLANLDAQQVGQTQR